MSACSFSINAETGAYSRDSSQCPQRCPYIFTTIHHRVSHDFTSKESLVYTVQYHILCFKTYWGTMYYCCTLWTDFYPPDLCLSTYREFIVRYNIICCVSRHIYYYYLYCFCRLVFPLPIFVRIRTSLDDRCCMYVLLCCVCFLPIHSGHQWTYQPESHRRKVTQDFSSTFLLRCVP